MEESLPRKFDLTSFKRATEQMVATNDSAYLDDWTSRRYVKQLKDYTPEEIDSIVNGGSIDQQQRLSQNYFYKDGFYKRIIIHYATLLKYMGLLIPNPSFGQSLSNSNNSKRYHNAMDFVERINLPNFLTNCAVRALIAGSYYGIIQKLDKKTFAVLDLPTGYCCTRFKDTLGNDIIEFDITYFDTITSEKHRNEALAAYPKLISKAYRDYKKGKTSTKYVFIPADLGICFPLFDGRPLFLNVIPATIQYDEAVETERERELEEIRKIIVQKIPHLNDGRLVFEPIEAEEMHEGTVKMLKKNPNISVMTTYADVDSIVSRTSAEASNNNLEKMQQHIYAEGGVSSQLFGSTGTTTLESSLKNDTALMMYLANKFSIFVSNIVNSLYANGNLNFKYQILPITYYNEDKYVERSFKLAGSGYSLIMPALAMGISQRDLNNIKDLENDVLKLKDKLIPPSSSYTQSAAAAPSEGTPGAPAKEQEEKTPKTLEKEKSLEKNTGGSN